VKARGSIQPPNLGCECHSQIRTASDGALVCPDHFWRTVATLAAERVLEETVYFVG